MAVASAVALSGEPLQLNAWTVDLLRYQEIDEAPGRPYADFEVEYAPATLGVIRLLGAATPGQTGARVVLAMLVVDLLVAAALWYGWSRGAALAYLLLGLPLILFIYFRLDLLSVALAVGALATARRRHERTAGLLLAVGVLAKVWPVLLLPVFLVGKKWRAVAWFTASLAAGLAAWIWWAGFAGPLQVLTLRGASGWQVESTVGWLLWMTGGEVRQEAGSPRVGTTPPGVEVLLLAALAFILALTWRGARDHESASPGLPALISVAALLAVSPVLSLQYVTWLLPWSAITDGGGGRQIRALTFVVSALTATLFLAYWRGIPMRAPLLVGFPLGFRNGLIIVICLVAYQELQRRRRGTHRVSDED